MSDFNYVISALPVNAGKVMPHAEAIGTYAIHAWQYGIGAMAQQAIFNARKYGVDMTGPDCSVVLQIRQLQNGHQ